MKKIIYKTKEQVDNIRESWKYLNELLILIYENANTWVSLIELEYIAQSFIIKYNLSGAFKWYLGYPANLCLSINDCVVHGIPNEYKLMDGDLLKIDAWISYKWWISDAAISKIIWWNHLNYQWYELVKATKDWLDIAINQVWPNKLIYYFSDTIYKYIRSKWFNVLKYLTWHWVWENVHEWPYIYNWPHKDTGVIKFQSWMVLALEPITAINSTDFKENPRIPWSIFTKLWDLWAQREYTIAITDNGYELLAWITDGLGF